MMYLIVSPRLGNPGDPYQPADGVNVDALLEHGFIRAAENGSVSAKNKSKKADPQEH